MDQAVRNKLRNVVTQCRKLLEDATAQALQGRFGIYADRKKGEVQVEDESRMGHLAEEDRACRQDLLDHLEHIKAIGYSPREALDQLIREIAFTHLNRLCAYKMMEARGLIREAVSRGIKSQGFFFYLADHHEDERLHKEGRQDAAYRNYLDWLGGTLSQEIGVLFNPNDSANRLYPPQRLIDEVLGLINSDELAEIWGLDETIGWVYQYFTPKELRDQARKESQAPRNSYELAFRNQFYTPRYVVEFLTDNTLGRTWYEMRKGETSLKERCHYLVRRPAEIFLAKGEEPPAESKEPCDDLSQKELPKHPVYIPHRPKKDPREIKVLDPACGSGHFLLYCFGLLQVIYEEAYDDPDLAMGLRKDYPALEDLRREMPGLILQHNLHGIDIDLRVTQIAALALWLRCQRAYQELGLKNGERPQITRSNIVCAEPMPGEEDFLKEFTATLQPKVLGQLVEVVFEKMKLAGEAGSLLKIEEEIQKVSSKAKGDYIAWKKHQKKAKAILFPELMPREHLNLFDFADLTDEAFLDRAEEEIVTALRKYAEHTANGRAFRRRLFAEDAARGFAYVDICRKRYDVVLMNPPYGEQSSRARPYADSSYSFAAHEIYCCFFQRAFEICNHFGIIGSLTSRTFLTFSTFAHFRRHLLSKTRIYTIADLGFGVLDNAVVETAATVIKCSPATNNPSIIFRLLKQSDKESGLTSLIDTEHDQNRYVVFQEAFSEVPGTPFCYWAGSSLRRAFKDFPSFEHSGAKPTLGLVTGNNDRFLRLRWEIPEHLRNTRWMDYCKGGDYSKYYDDPHLLVDWRGNGKHIQDSYGQAVRLRDPQNYQQAGVNYPLVTVLGMNARVMPCGCIFDNTAPSVLQEKPEDIWIHLAYVNTRIFEYFVRLLTSSRHWQVGYLRSVPFPLLTESVRREIEGLVKKCVSIRMAWDGQSEVSHIFFQPFVVKVNGSLISQLCDIYDKWEVLSNDLASYSYRIDRLILSAFEIGDEFAETLDEELNYNTMTYISKQIGPVACNDLPNVDVLMSLSPSIGADPNNIRSCRAQIEEESRYDYRDAIEAMVSYIVGCCVGRWNVDLSLVDRTPNLFANNFLSPLPVCPPGMLQGPDGLPAKPEDVPSHYPIRIDWDGIIVDDPVYENDVVRRVREVLEVIWKERSEAIEREACDILGVRELRDYFRKPGNGGFWMDHVKRYSKSRRKAPIYWYLRSAKGNYGLWLYYHRLDKDLLFKALLNYVEPKIRLEEGRLKTLRSRKEVAGSSGREAKQLERDLDRQDQLISELHDFKDKLRRAADLHLAPDLNDGVVLNIAPLWELVPWKEAQNYWDELFEGKYDWSSIGKQLREKGLTK